MATNQIDRQVAFRCVSLLLAACALLAEASHSSVLRADDPQATFQLVVPAAAPGNSEREKAHAEAAAKKAAEAASKTAGDDRANAGKGEILGFGQSKVTAQMNELEQRMYRLSEGLKELEPENASRLMLGLKFAREELILLQMSQTEGLLKDLKLGEAVVEEKQLLAKIDRLKQLLLSDDLDFQLRLERLRMLRQVVKQLEVAIKEEDREQKNSRQAAANQKDVSRLRKKQTDLAELIQRQTGHVAETEELSKTDAAAEGTGEKLDKLSNQQQSTRDATKQLAASEIEQGQKPKRLGDAEAKMTSAAETLSKHQAKETLEPARQALDLLQQELEETESQLAKTEGSISNQRFASMRKDQTGNHQLADRITEMVRSLGENGARALGEMIRAGGNMQNAEGALGKREAEPASGNQLSATKSLQLARDELLREEQELLKELHVDVRKRVLESLVAMLEKQQAVRESTETLSPAVGKGSRQALATVVGLAKSEAEIIQIDTDLIALVEETKFGIALPSALRVVRRQMEAVQDKLAAGQASEPVIEAERQVEADLKDLLEAMQRMPDTPKQPGKPRRGSREQERELNRLIAELRMIRLMQIRVNGETVTVDGKRAAEIEAIAEDLRKEILAVEQDQDGVRATTDRLAIERGDELTQ